MNHGQAQAPWCWMTGRFGMAETGPLAFSIGWNFEPVVGYLAGISLT